MRTIINFLFFILVLSSCKEAKLEKPGSSSDSPINYQEISAELEALHDEDQRYRARLTEMIINKEPFDNEFVQEMNISDSVNKIRMIEILDQHGWISKDHISEKAFDATFLVIQHADVKTMEKFYPDFRKLASTDSTILVYAGMMQDRILMYNSKKQIYGTQASSRLDTAGYPEYFIWPIENPEEVNLRRKAAGFEETIEEYTIGMEAIYDPNEKLIQFGSK